MNSADYYLDRLNECENRVQELEDDLETERALFEDSQTWWEDERRKWVTWTLAALVFGAAMGYCLRGRADEMRIEGVQRETRYDGDYARTTVQFTHMDGTYTVWMWETPDFKEWHKVWLLDFDGVGCFNIDFVVRQNRWQLYDKTYKPCFWRYELQRTGESEQWQL